MPIISTCSVKVYKVRCVGVGTHKPHYFDHYCRIFRTNKKRFCEEALRIRNKELGRKRYEKNIEKRSKSKT